MTSSAAAATKQKTSPVKQGSQAHAPAPGNSVELAEGSLTNRRYFYKTIYASQIEPFLAVVDSYGLTLIGNACPIPVSSSILYTMQRTHETRGTDEQIQGALDALKLSQG